jgi:hypothetical protein
VILNAATAMAASLAADTQPVAHVIFSGQNGTAAQVKTYSVDDAFDTIRRRGARATVRQTAAVASYPLALGA